MALVPGRNATVLSPSSCSPSDPQELFTKPKVLQSLLNMTMTIMLRTTLTGMTMADVMMTMMMNHVIHLCVCLFGVFLVVFFFFCALAYRLFCFVFMRVTFVYLVLLSMFFLFFFFFFFFF